MSIKYYANNVLETSTTGGSGNLILLGSPLGSRTFVDAIGANKRFTYHIYRQDTNLVWEIGVGYVVSSGGVNQLVRETIVSSSSNGSIISLPSYGTSYITTIISESRVNNGFTNVVPTGSSFTADYISATYIIDASAANIAVSLPEVTSSKDSIILGFVLNKTINDQYEQTNAVLIDGYNSQLIDGNTTTSINIINDYLQLISIPSASGWIKLDPIQDSVNPYGNEGNIQFKSVSAFSGTNNFTWNNTNLSLLVGSSGVSTADIVLAASGTSIINQKQNSVDFQVGGSNNANLLFVDGSSNTIGINTNSTDNALTVNASGTSGATIYKSGVGPALHLYNNSPNGTMTSDIIGSVVYSGLNSNNNGIKYASVYTKTVSEAHSNESASVHVGIMNDGAFEDVAVFGPGGAVLGFNNTNQDGIVVGEASSNEGANVLIGYYNNVCGEDCVVIGDDNVIATGSFGGLIGVDHAASGYNVWIIGGSGISATGQNILILGIDENNYISIPNSGSIKYSSFSSDGTNFQYHNNKALSTGGVDETLSFTFQNAADITKTGLQIISTIDTVTNNNESATFKAKVVNGGTMKEIIRIGTDSAMFGQNTAVDGINIIYGYDNVVNSTGNIIYGRDINQSGIHNVIFGDNIAFTGSGMVVFGIDNIATEYGDENVIMFGSGNSAGEAAAVAIGIDNANSGLYSLSCGYLNGVHGDYSVGLGNSNVVNANSSVAVGKNNTLTNTAADAAIYVAGVGNNATIAGTGVVVGFNNNLRGTSGYIFGNNVVTTGNNNFVVGADVFVTGNNNILLSTDVNASISGSNIVRLQSSSNEFINVASTGIYIKSTGTFVIEADLNIPGVVTAEKLVANTGTGYGLEISSSGLIESGLYVYNDVYTSGLSGYGSGITFREDVVFNSGVDIAEGLNVGDFIYGNNLIYITGPTGGESILDCNVDITGALQTSEHILCLTYIAIAGDLAVGNGLIIGQTSPPNQQNTLPLTGIYVYGSGVFTNLVDITSGGLSVRGAALFGNDGNIGGIRVSGSVGTTGIYLEEGSLYAPEILFDKIAFTGDGLPDIQESYGYKNVYQQIDGSNYTLVSSDLLTTYNVSAGSVSIGADDAEIIFVTGIASSEISLTLPTTASDSLKTFTIVNKSNQYLSSSNNPVFKISPSGSIMVSNTNSTNWVTYGYQSELLTVHNGSNAGVTLDLADSDIVVVTGSYVSDVTLALPTIQDSRKTYTIVNKMSSDLVCNSPSFTIPSSGTLTVSNDDGSNWVAYNQGLIGSAGEATSTAKVITLNGSDVPDPLTINDPSVILVAGSYGGGSTVSLTLPTNISATTIHFTIVNKRDDNGSVQISVGAGTHTIGDDETASFVNLNGSSWVVYNTGVALTI